jgi:hypothetical protein
MLKESMPRRVFLPASLILPALGFGTPARAQSLTVAEFPSRCDTDPAYCQEEVSRIERMSNAIPGANCPPENMSIDTMTSSVVGSLQQAVEEDSTNAMANADTAIEQVLPVLWPCSH